MAWWQMRWWDFLLTRCQQQTPLHQQALIDIPSDSRSPFKRHPCSLRWTYSKFIQKLSVWRFSWQIIHWNEAKVCVVFSKSLSKMNNWKSDIHMSFKLCLFNLGVLSWGSYDHSLLISMSCTTQHWGSEYRSR